MASAYDDVQGLAQVRDNSQFDRIMNNWLVPGYAQSEENRYLANQDKLYNAYEAQKTREFNSREAQLQRDFEERMSNTAFSRAVADMKSVGLNPYLATGASASTPQGVSASGSSAYASSRSGMSGNGGVIGSLVNDAVTLASAFLRGFKG